MATTGLIILRHGETVWNREDRYQGHLDSPLTPLGLEQACALAARLAASRCSALYSSDLGRARHTAEIIADKTGQRLQLDPRLRERHLGIFQGLVQSEIERKFPDDYRLFKSGDPDYVVPGGESSRQRFACAIACFEELASRHGGEQIAVVTHGGVLSALFRHTLGIPLGAPRRFARSNATWNLFTCQRKTWFLETWGDVSHLSGVPDAP